MKGKPWTIPLSVFAMAVLSLASSALAQPPTVTRTIAAERQRAASDFWTRDRIAGAPAMVLQVDMEPAGEVADAVGAMAESAHIGPEGSSPPGMPAPDADQVAQFAYWTDWSASSGHREVQPAQEPDAADVGTEGTRNVYTNFDVNYNTAFWKVPPHKWIGKLTFRTYSGASSSCSATAISNNHIVTAAHCVYDTQANRWMNSWVFTPAYRNGTAPYGTFAAQSATVLTAWINLTGPYSINTMARYDVAVLGVGKNSAGQTLNQAVGWAGRSWNAGYSQLNFIAGYPAYTYTNVLIGTGPSQYLRACINESFTQTTETLGGGCYYGRGMCGGPWLVGYKPFVASGQVNSVTAGEIVGQPNLYGARFNSYNIVPLCTAEGC